MSIATRMASIAVVALTAMGTLGACGADPDEAQGGRGGDAAGTAAQQDAFLQYARCMRENGIAMDDPEPGGGLLLNGKDVDPEALESAEEECHHLVDGVLPRSGGLGVSPEQKEAMLAQARCMRERGWNMPDPQFDGGRVSQQLGGALDPEDPAFQEDQAACGKKTGVEAPTLAGGSR